MARPRKSFAIRVVQSDTPADPEAVKRAERVFARLIAKAYIADHPEMFGRSQPAAEGEPSSRPGHGCEEAE